MPMGFVEECKQARDLGFDGKTLIHPRQIEPCNEAFSPSPEEVAMARKMIAAFEEPGNENKGVIQIDGRMVERLHAEMARPTVAIADAIEQQKNAQPAEAKAFVSLSTTCCAPGGLHFRPAEHIACFARKSRPCPAASACIGRS